MHITNLVIDGFKSYGSKTQIGPFDPEFNAITGMNGTGKSNILDAIMFAMGLSNLSDVRAANMTELIYKGGQAGVTQASVTLVFNNSDKNNSPFGYHLFDEIDVTRQINVGGKNKFLINGFNVANKQVTDFFKSVQLNVKNPHFLIMQGKIARVLNMRPIEILSMLEESAGTSMYKSKKYVAKKSLESKEIKIKAINDIIEEKINPKIQKIQKEKDDINQLQKINRELEKWEKIQKAYTYYKIEISYTTEKQRMSELSKEAKIIISNKLSADKEISELDLSIANLKMQLENCRLHIPHVESDLKSKESIEAKSVGQLTILEENIRSANEKYSLCEKALSEDKKYLSEKEAELEKAEEQFGDLKDKAEGDAEALANAEKKFTSVSQGLLSNKEGQDATIQYQIMAAQEQLTNAESDIQQLSLDLENLKKSLEEKEIQLTDMKQTHLDYSESMENRLKELDNLKKKLCDLKYRPDLLQELKDLEETLESTIKSLMYEIDAIESRYPKLKFDFKDPEPKFNRKSVKGLVCTLFTIKDPKFIRALETIAGSKLYYVVVDNEETSAKLITNGSLNKRYTFAPMNKITGNKLAPKKVKEAQKLVGPKNIFLAQSLINYSPEYENIMSWIFGQTFVCLDMDNAVAVSESKNIKNKAVTLDGDIFDPCGVISGGAIEIKNPILQVLDDLRQNKRNLKSEMIDLRRLKDKISAAETLENSATEVALIEAELENMKLINEQSSYSTHKNEIQELLKRIEECNSAISEKYKFVEDRKNRIDELEIKLKNIQEIKEEELKSAAKYLHKMQRQAAESNAKWQKQNQGLEAIRCDIEQLKVSLAKQESVVVKEKKELLEAEKDRDNCKLKMAESQKEAVDAREEYRIWVSREQDTSICLQNALKLKHKLDQETIDFNFKKLSNDNDQKRSSEEISKYKSLLKDLASKESWILEDKCYFGAKGGIYDFEENNPEYVCEKMNSLIEEKDKIIQELDSEQEQSDGQQLQFVQVLSKKDILDEDRVKIHTVMDELDEKKEELIRNAWEKVNNDFDSILSTLLPGANAKLEIVEGKNLLDGLEIRVGFGNVWKDSLDELSGGQRSLVALSFVLSMLLFKPAPLYILDEVDAALDPSHTENIGKMLKKHFNQSQFIVVSLKDGMFSKANVLFRTDFADAVSKVIRTCGDDPAGHGDGCF